MLVTLALMMLLHLPPNQLQVKLQEYQTAEMKHFVQ